MFVYDVLVIGSGPAGVSAALTLKTNGVAVAVASLMGSYLLESDLPTDYYGLTATDGQSLYRQGLTQMQNMAIPFLEQEILGLSLERGVFTAMGATPIQAKRVLLATGKPKPYTLPSYCEEFLSKGVHLQAEESGFLYRNRMVGVVGKGDYAIAQVNLLKNIARTVTLFTDGDTTKPYPKDISVNRYPLKALSGNRLLERVTFENGTSLNIDGLFFANRTATAVDLASGVGVKTTSPFLSVDQKGMTSCRGLFAVGDCTAQGLDLHTQTIYGHRVAQEIAKSL